MSDQLTANWRPGADMRKAIPEVLKEGTHQHFLVGMRKSIWECMDYGEIEALLRENELLRSGVVRLSFPSLCLKDVPTFLPRSICMSMASF